MSTAVERAALDFGEILEISRQDYARGFFDGLYPQVVRRGRPPCAGSESAAYWYGHGGGICAAITLRHLPARLEKWDKDAIKSAFKANQPLPDGVTVERGQHVRIR